MPRVKKPVDADEDGPVLKKLKKKARPAGRKTGWEWRSPCGQFGIIEITTEVGTPTFYNAYILSPNSMELTKVEAPGQRKSYVVFFGKVCFCGCESFKRSPLREKDGQQECKHVKALQAMREAGRL